MIIVLKINKNKGKPPKIANESKIIKRKVRLTINSKNT